MFADLGVLPSGGRDASIQGPKHVPPAICPSYLPGWPPTRCVFPEDTLPHTPLPVRKNFIDLGEWCEWWLLESIPGIVTYLPMDKLPGVVAVVVRQAWIGWTCLLRTLRDPPRDLTLLHRLERFWDGSSDPSVHLFAHLGKWRSAHGISSGLTVGLG